MDVPQQQPQQPSSYNDKWVLAVVVLYFDLEFGQSEALPVLVRRCGSLHGTGRGRVSAPAEPEALAHGGEQPVLPGVPGLA